MTTLVFVVAALAAYRLTMLVVADEITEPIRDRIIERYIHPAHELIDRPDPQEPKWDSGYPYSAKCRCGLKWVGNTWSDVMSEANGHVNPHYGEMTTGPKWLILLDCPWCASFWVSIPVAWSAWTFGDRGWWFVPAMVLAFSAISGIVATFAKPGH